MTTSNRPDDEQFRSEGQVQHLLWRLRARLVAPPREQQVEEDLSRLFETARDHAHGRPSSYASKQPGPVAGSQHPEYPLTATAGDELSARRAGRIASLGLGRAAAASVAALVLGVGVSHAAGGPVSFDTFFGRDGQVIADETDPSLAAPPTDDTDEAQDDSSDQADDEVADVDASEPDALALPDDDATSADDADAAADADARSEVEAEADVEEEPAPDDSSEPEGAASESSGDEVADETEDTVEDVTGDAEAGEILAGPSDPPADSLEGFGDGQRCEGDDLASCLPVDEDEGGPTVDEDEDEDAEAEDLASRRFRPDADDDEAADPAE